MTPILFSNARIFDGRNAECPEGMSVLVEGGLIREVSDKPIKAATARAFDVKGRTLMPGLIDVHTHAYASDVNMFKVEALGPGYRTAHAVRMLGWALDCGFTTVRDVGGGDYSLARAIADGLVRSPRGDARWYEGPGAFVGGLIDEVMRRNGGVPLDDVAALLLTGRRTDR